MLLSPVLFIFFVVALIILTIGLLISLFSYIHSSHKLRSIEQENKALKQTAESRSIKSLAKVQEQTEDIILQANRKAADLLAEAKLFSSDERELIQHKLSHIVEGQIEAFTKINELLDKEYQSELEDTKKEAVKLFANTSQSITDTANKEIVDFKTALEQQTVNSQKIVTQRIEEAYKQVAEEVNEYKKTKLEEVDQAASQHMHAIANYVLGNGLTIDQQEILIRTAIQELKKQSK